MCVRDGFPLDEDDGHGGSEDSSCGGNDGHDSEDGSHDDDDTPGDTMVVEIGRESL